jgi:hypothetical protein
MKHIISLRVADSPGFIEIDEAEYNLIKDARGNLFEALYLEENLDLVIENYYEYESDLLSISSRMMIFNDDYFSMGRERSLLTRRIANLLSAGRMYIDQSPHHLNNMYGKESDIPRLVENEKKLQYEQRLGYRVMEAIRNYAQHRDVPIQGIKLSYHLVESETGSQFLYRAIPLINISTLADDKFKQTILQEIRDTSTKDLVDVRPFIKEYVEGIGTLHVKTRELIHPDLIKWEETLDNAITKYKNKFGDNAPLVGLSIIKESDDGHWEEAKTLFKNFIKDRQELENKNSNFINLHKSFASDEIRKDD